ncbi:MAG: hypothetical protein DHS20C01_00990 [marine bacterium B5-7]|nr:MAG: hypothetical protein DHS20C01_00990 [marine bacterium B5-7]
MRLNRSIVWLVAVITIVGLFSLFIDKWQPDSRWAIHRPDDAKTTIEVKRGEFSVHSIFDGVVESRRVVTIASRYQGKATLIELVAEGTRVVRGDVLARFDTSEIVSRVTRLEQELAIAKAELQGLENALIPLKLKELELTLEDTARKLSAEQRYLDDSLKLQQDNMVSDQEVLLQKRKVRSLESEVEQAQLTYTLTRDFLHPAELAKAKTAVLTAEQSLEVARAQLENSEVTAPVNGVVVYKPLSIGSEFRRVRVGDTLFTNQPFMILPDMSDLLVVINVPETELDNVEAGAVALLQPVAYPDISFEGTVDQVAAVAHSVPGRPEWQKYFRVIIGLNEKNPKLRPGMTTVVQILSHYAENVLRIPRRAVSWEDNAPFVDVVKNERIERRELVVGRSSLEFYEIRQGLEPGEWILIH